MKRINGIMIGTVVILVVALAGCSGRTAPSAAGGALSSAPAANLGTPAAPSEYTSLALPAAYDNALPAGTQLALGILRLEGTARAVTPAQAKTLLPFWQAFQGNALQNDTERNAVLKQVEAALTADQVRAIADMKLTNDDMRKWMEESGTQFMPAGTPGPGGAGSPPGDLTDAQRQAFRATAEAGGGPPGGGAFGNMTDAQRQAFRATAEAGGRQFPPGSQGGQAPTARGTPGTGRAGGGAFRFASYRIFAAPLVKLLTERAAQ